MMAVRSETAMFVAVDWKPLASVTTRVSLADGSLLLYWRLLFPAMPAPAVQFVPPTYESFFLLLMAIVIPPISFEKSIAQDA